MKAILAILAMFTSYTVNCQTYIDTLPNGRVSVCFGVTEANNINSNYNELVYLRKKDSLQVEAQNILLSVLDSCEKQRANDAYKIDTLVSICKQLEERYKTAVFDKNTEQKRVLEYKAKNNNKNWALISLVLISILGFVV